MPTTVKLQLSLESLVEAITSLSNSKFGMFILHRQKCRNMCMSRFSFSVNITQSFL